jgi:uncharacterized protein YjiS (DUF1127 family)
MPLILEARKLIQRAARFVRASRDLSDVRAMNDHALRDIGLSRADIYFAIRTGRLPDR